ncbi:30S ribosomal protein S16 [Thalassoglobus polymorphus]|uniref:Small ribosomal subunit protein bS16 n=1 Tax=Thalassoglobus polymorphus TaxID=2527994 RepID=A0A517QI56_9PLAN|nr:30S ribosomal protein S16 [Thalassoglobus polymorphus]QDT31247.1 30S ribosomal protein S16 [Thalassoglobus polymorphus]
MAVRIRMKKLGRTHRPFYRICIMDARKPRDGEAIEEVGTYDPMKMDKSQRVTLKMDRIDHWISVGAQPSEKVAVLIRKFKDNDWGETKSPPPMEAPKVKKAPEPEASEDAPAEEEAEAPAES